MDLDLEPSSVSAFLMLIELKLKPAVISNYFYCLSVYFAEWISGVFLCHRVVTVWVGRCVSRQYWCWFADVEDCCRNTRRLHTLSIDSVAHTISLLVARCDCVLTLIELSRTLLYFCLESRLYVLLDYELLLQLLSLFHSSVLTMLWCQKVCLVLATLYIMLFCVESI